MAFNKRVISLLSLIVIIGIIIELSRYYPGNKIDQTSGNQLVVGSIEPLCTDQFTPIKTLSDLKNYEIQIEIPKSRKWVINLFEAKNSNSKSIEDLFKKKFNAIIIVSDSDESTCEFEARVRISGDWKDHIRFQDQYPVASLDVQMKTGNLAGIVDFKLLLPETRGGENELILSNLFRNFDILSPRTAFMDVNVNGVTVKYLFEENIAKELLESQDRREAPLFETNEEWMWEDLRKLGNWEDGRTQTPKLLNDDWIGTSKNRAEIAKRGTDIALSAYVQMWESGELSDEYMTNGDLALLEKYQEFIAIMYASNSIHGLTVMNQRFYFDPIRNGFEPIYYDGDAKLTNIDRELIPANNSGILGSKLALNNLEQLNSEKFAFELKSLGSSLTPSEINAILDKLQNNLANYEISPIETKKLFSWGGNNFSDLYSENRKIAFAASTNSAQICDFDLKDCFQKELSIEEFTQLISGKLKIDEQSIVYVGSSLDVYQKNLRPEQASLPLNKIFELDGESKLQVSEQAEVIVDNKNRKITIVTKSIFTRAVIQGGKLENWQINFEMQKTSETSDLEDRFDSRLLTGCVTIADVELINSSFQISNTECEDALNFIRSTGTIKNILISNTAEDGLDADFSQLEIQKIDISDTGNDCVDFSQGNYNVTEFIGTACGDKGISIGEMATAYFGKSKIIANSIGIAVKDWSVVTAEFIDVNASQSCVSSYRKKQEFGSAKIQITSLTCNSKILPVQEHSLLEINHDF